MIQYSVSLVSQTISFLIPWAQNLAGTGMNGKLDILHITQSSVGLKFKFSVNYDRV
jgi:hypothetical protein